MNYLTMIFDLKDSRHIKNRYEVQLNLIDAIKKCNIKFHDIIAADFLITIGDEWEGLLKSTEPYHDIIKFFHDELPNDIEFYVGIGIGPIYIHNFELTVNQLDGPSFYMARDAIKLAKENNYKIVLIEY